MGKLWGGRFTKHTDSFADSFNASLSFDSRMYQEDILGSIAHAKMLGKQGIIKKQDAEAIVSGLTGILEDLTSGALTFSNASDEDIHSFVERVLTERIGAPGKMLHTGRSRNDQVALDLKLYVKREITETVSLLKELLLTLLTLAEANTESILPAYTHMQKAQPTTLAHHLLAYAEMFSRDISRFEDAYRRMDVMPLGSGAVASTTYPLDRAFVAKELDFSGITRNSMDGVSDRDFALEYLFCASTAMMHLSRFAEEMVLWSTGEFSFVTMDDAFSTGSSIMPQKKNPDMAELVRGKTGRVYGSLFTLLTVLKGLPLAYNKDMQEDKECVFDAIDTLKSSLIVFNGMIKTAHFETEHMKKAAGLGFTNATDLADYLVKKGMPFRNAHEVTGKVVLYCEEKGVSISELSKEELSSFSELISEDVFESISLSTCVNERKLPGGPAKESVLKEISALKKLL